MPTFEFTGPDGKSYEVSGPEGSTAQEAFGHLQSQIGQSTPEAAAPPPEAPTVLAPERPHTGYAATVRATMSGENPVAHGQARPVGEIAKSYGDIAQGVPTGAIGGVLGIPGNVESLGRAGLNAVGAPVSTESFLPTSGRVEDAMAGPAPNSDVATGRAIGELIGPAAGVKAVKGASLAVGRPIAGGGPTEAAKAASDAGYKLPPAMASKSPGVVSQALGAISGKLKLQQAASAVNQQNTNRLAAEALGLHGDELLTEEALDAVRKVGGQAYSAVSKAVPEIVPDDQFRKTASALGNRLSEAAKAFPGLVKNDEIENLSQTLQDAQAFSPQAGLDLVKHLRSDAVSNIKAFDDPGRQALGLAQRHAAEAVDDLMERRISEAGKPDIVHSYRDARQLIARSYDVQAAIDANGDVSARVIAGLAKKGRPLSGELKDIASAGSAFPKATQRLANVGGEEKIGILDLGAAAASHGATLPLSLGRPASRNILLSPTFQNMLMRPPALNGLADRTGSVNAFALAVPDAVRPENALNYAVNRPK